MGTKINELVSIAEERLQDADVLFKGGRYTGAAYLSGYVLECLFKALTCKALGFEELPAVLQTAPSHNVENIIQLVPSVDEEMRSDEEIHEPYTRVISDKVKLPKLRYETETLPAVYVQEHLKRVKEIRRWIKEKLKEKKVL